MTLIYSKRYHFSFIDLVSYRNAAQFCFNILPYKKHKIHAHCDMTLGGLLEPFQQHDTKSMPYPQWSQQWSGHLTLSHYQQDLVTSQLCTPLIHATTCLHHL